MKVNRLYLGAVAAAVTFFLVIAGIHLLRTGISPAPDFSCSSQNTGTTVIDVHSGESGSDIARELRDKGVTKSFDAFFRVAVGDKRSEGIAPGLHTINLAICAKDALDQLLDNSRIGNLLSIPEGSWNSEIKDSLLKIGYSKNEITQGFAKVSPPKPFSSLEGLLFPAQYSFDSATSVVEILDLMITRGSGEIKHSGILAGDGKLSAQQLLIIASLVQAEGDEKDFAKISQVVRNRITKGMPLQFDSTVHYIKKSRGSVFLSTQSTLINSPYNTYRRYGLPPGPINNPGFPAMYAAAHPESGAWLFFITVAPGDTRFTDSIEEFNSWKVLYKKNLRAGKFGSKK